jgi:predicted lipoprotein with Yx(FWY)xxD motif
MTRAAIVAGALGLLVSACGSGGGDSAGGATGASSALVTTTSVDGTSTLADSSGKTLYSANVEANGQIKCLDTCTTFWQPLMATAKQATQASNQIGESFGVVSRPDGGSQLALDGAPLYTFAEEGAGELKGNGFTDDFQGSHFVWSAAGTDGSAPAPSSAGGGGRYGY